MPEILSLLPHLFIFLIFYISLGSYIYLFYTFDSNQYYLSCCLHFPSFAHWEFLQLVLCPFDGLPSMNFFLSILLHSTFSPLQDVVPSSTCTFPTPLQENPCFSLHFTFGFWRIPVRYEDLGSRYPSTTWVLLLHAPLSWQGKHSWSIGKRVYFLSVNISICNHLDIYKNKHECILASPTVTY